MVKVVDLSYEVLYFPENPEQMIERAARTCYKSEDKITDGSAQTLIRKLIKRGHLAMLEFGGDPVVRFVCNRGVSHEFVRHRLCSFAQESTRYCNYGQEKHGNQITVIDPREMFTLPSQYFAWHDAMEAAENEYLKATDDDGLAAQIARGRLPIDTKTELVMKGNIRQWRHFFALRAAAPAHPQARALASSLLANFRSRSIQLFGDVGSEKWDGCQGVQNMGIYR